MTRVGEALISLLNLIQQYIACLDEPFFEKTGGVLCV